MNAQASIRTHARTATITAIALGALTAIIAACIALCLALPEPAHASQRAGTAQMQGTAAAKTAQATKAHKISTAAQWHNIAKYNGGTFKIMKNIKLKNTSQYLKITKNKKYTIDLNGKKISTTYSGNAKRSVPFSMTKGTVTFKSSKKNKGVLYSTEAFCVSVSGGTFRLKSGGIYDDYVNFRDDSTGTILVSGTGKCHLSGGKVVGVTNGVVGMGKARIYTTGAGTKTYPYIRAGAMKTSMAFTHFGSAINIMSRSAKLSLKGGSLGTKATPDAALPSVVGTYYYTQSGHYPVLDMYGKALKAAKGFKYIDAGKAKVPIRQDAVNSTYAGLSPKKMLETWTKSTDGYYAVYVVKA